jgi:hypothetical protein
MVRPLIGSDEPGVLRAVALPGPEPRRPAVDVLFTVPLNHYGSDAHVGQRVADGAEDIAKPEPAKQIRYTC